jgi:hypothetical protein
MMVVGGGNQFGPVLLFLSFSFLGCQFSRNSGFVDDFWLDTYAKN